MEWVEPGCEDLWFVLWLVGDGAVLVGVVFGLGRVSEDVCCW